MTSSWTRRRGLSARSMICLRRRDGTGGSWRRRGPRWSRYDWWLSSSSVQSGRVSTLRETLASHASALGQREGVDGGARARAGAGCLPLYRRFLELYPPPPCLRSYSAISRAHCLQLGLTNEENEGVVDSERYRACVSRRQLRKWNHSCSLDRVVAVASRRAASSVKSSALLGGGLYETDVLGARERRLTVASPCLCKTWSYPGTGYCTDTCVPASTNVLRPTFVPAPRVSQTRGGANESQAFNPTTYLQPAPLPVQPTQPPPLTNCAKHPDE